MRKIGVLGVCVLTGVVVGCRGPDRLAIQRATSYGRLAVVCVPGEKANPNHARVVISQVREHAPSGLHFLQKVGFPRDVTVDTGTAPPTVTLGEKASDYDAIALLVYSHSDEADRVRPPAPGWAPPFVYGDLEVCLDIYMIDAKSGEMLWYHPVTEFDRSVRSRLARMGGDVPAHLRRKFYRW